MAEEKAEGAAKEGGGDEVDVARAAIWFLGILLVGLVGVLLLLRSKRDQFQEAVAYGEKNLKRMAAQYDGVKGLLKEYRESDADEAERNYNTWFKQRYSNAGIQDGQVTVEGWKEKPTKEFLEKFVPVTVKGIRMDQAVQFVWNVERMSTKFRTIDLKLTRTAPNNTPEADVWELRASFGYRIPRLVREGS